MENVEHILPLSPMQRDILIRTLQTPELHEYVEQVCWTLRGDLDSEAFEVAWRRVLARHPTLRTAFFYEGLNEPVQVVRQRVELAIEVEDWRRPPEVDDAERFERMLAEDRRRDFVLSSAPLMRVRQFQVGDDAWRFVWSYHHLLLDGWSATLCLREVLTQYEALVQGKPAPPEPPVASQLYLSWLRRQDAAKAEAFWRDTLAGFRSPTSLSLGSSTPRGGITPGAKTVALREDLSDALRRTARRLQLSLYTLFEGAWALLLSRYAGMEDVVFGSAGSGRPPDLPGSDAMLGVFIRTLPVRVRAQPSARTAEWLAQLQKLEQEARRHDFVPLSLIAGWSDVPRGHRLFEHLFVFQNLPEIQFKQANIGRLTLSEFERVHSKAGMGHALVVLVEPAREIRVELTHDATIAGAMADRMVGHYTTLLEAIAADPERPLGELSLLTASERQQVVTEWNRTAAAYPHERAVHQLVAEQAARTPDDVAVVFEGDTLTYAELERRANQLAHHLRRQGVGPEVRVGVCLERSTELVVGLLAVLKAGGVYLPLDPEYPGERLAYMLTDSGARVLLTETGLRARVPLESGAVVVELDAPATVAAVAAEPTRGPAVAGLGPANLVYVLYTSGSTGRPKGVMVSHGAVVNFLAAMAREPGVTAEDTLLAVTTLAFDIAGLELWLPLTTGARVVLASREVATDGRRLAAALTGADITVLQATPATWRMLIEAGWSGSPGLTALCGGEALPAALSEQLLARCAALWNLYGPTETTIWSTVSCVRPGTPISLGRPVANTRLYVLDRHGEPVPVGVAGELYVGGVGLARGYLGRPALTAEKFVPDPFGEEPGARLYRTGDRARWRASGELEFLGRLDQQIKLRGYRIEPGEIEAVLRTRPDVLEAVVVAREGRTGDMRLVAYVIPRNGTVGMSEAPESMARLEQQFVPQLKAYVRGQIPDHMVPTDFVVLEGLPLTPSGKVDRQALPALTPQGGGRPHCSTPYVAPRNEVEERIVEVWENLLGVQPVGIHDDFLELGGHSLLATRLLGRLRSLFAIDIPMNALFRSPTVAFVSDLVIERLTEDVVELSEEEALRLL